MFTGIVQTTGPITAITPQPHGVTLHIGTSGLPSRPDAGDSVCVSGVCLTVAGSNGRTHAFDVIQETLDKSKLGAFAAGGAVNLELSVTPNQPMGGHFMQGHVDGVGEVTEVRDDEADWRVRVKPPSDLMPYMVSKGSVAIDGVSLTLSDVGDDTIEVALIPTTLEETTLKQLAVGDPVNLEADIFAKTVVATVERMLPRMIAAGAEGGDEALSLDQLRRAGFLPEPES